MYNFFFAVGVQIAQAAIHFVHFQVQARKRAILGWANTGLWAKFGVFCVFTYL